MAFPVNYSVYHSGPPATPMKPKKVIRSAIAVITEFPFGKENIQPVSSNVQPPSTPPRNISPQTPTTPTATPSTPPRSPSPNQHAVPKTPSPNKRSSSSDTDSEPSSKRLKIPPSLSAASEEAEASLLSSLLPDFSAFSEETSSKACTPSAPSVSAEDENQLARRRKMLTSGKYPAVETALSLLEKNALAGHQKRELLGAGNFCETFATEDPKFVVKHLHHDGAMLRLFFSVANYWAQIHTNYKRLETLGVPVAEIQNIATLKTDLFAVQRRVKPMKELDSQHLLPGSQFAQQLKTAIATCYHNNLIIEIAMKNIGFIETPAGPLLQLIDIDDQTEEDGVDLNLEQPLKSFGNELRAYLDPRTK